MTGIATRKILALTENNLFSNLSRKDNTESNVPYDTPKIFWAEGSNDGISWWPIQDKNHANPPPIFTS